RAGRARCWRCCRRGGGDPGSLWSARARAVDDSPAARRTPGLHAARWRGIQTRRDCRDAGRDDWGHESAAASRPASSAGGTESMTTNPMTCETFSDRLMAYLEHETDDATRAAIEGHTVTCAQCGAVLADLRKLR